MCWEGGKGGRLVSWEGGKDGRSVSWKGGKGGRIVGWQGWRGWKVVTWQVVLTALAKSRSARRASHQSAFISRCLNTSHTCLPCLPSERTLLY